MDRNPCRGEYREANARVAELDRRVKARDTELARGPGSAQIEHCLTRELRTLQPAQRQTLQRSLPVPHQRLLTAVMWAGHSFVDSTIPGVNRTPRRLRVRVSRGLMR